MALPSSGSGRFRGRFNSNFSKDEHRINERIRVPEVRLIDENGGQVGVVQTREALRMARERNLDLMEVAPNARPPVCKICDYGKFKYEKKKKDKQAKKNQVVINVKEIQLRPNTDEHDLEYKFKNARAFLEEGDKVKATMLFRGREIAHNEVGRKLMLRLRDEMAEISDVEHHPKLEGRKMIMILAPKKAKTAGPKNPEEKKAAPKGKKDAPKADSKPNNPVLKEAPKAAADGKGKTLLKVAD